MQSVQNADHDWWKALIKPLCCGGRVVFPGNHILPDEDLAAFHWSLLGPEHPLASLKVNLQLLSCAQKCQNAWPHTRLGYEARW